MTVDRPITDLSLRMMADGVKIMGELTKPSKVARLNAQSFRIILTQGLNRQIRRMCSALGYKAQRLQRVRIMNIQLGNLQPGQWRHLTAAELAGLAGLGACASELLVGPQRGGRDAIRPLPSAADAPIGILGPIREPSIKVPALIGPIRMVEQHAAGARPHGEASAKAKARNAARAADSRRVFRQRILIRADLQTQTSALSIDADIGSRSANQRDAMNERRRRVAGGPGSAEGVPLEHHALAAKIDDRNGGGVIHGHAFNHTLRSFCRSVGKRAFHDAGREDLRQNHRLSRTGFRRCKPRTAAHRRGRTPPALW